jgi:hypothetical protein
VGSLAVADPEEVKEMVKTLEYRWRTDTLITMA